MLFIKNGYLNEEVFAEKTEIRNQEIIKQRGIDNYREAWKLYNQSFQNNEKKFVRKLFSGFRSNINHLDIRQLDETVLMLRYFNSNKNANILVNDFVKTRFNSELMVLMKRGHSDFKVKDKYLLQKLNEKLHRNKGKAKTLKDILSKLSPMNFEYSEYIQFLASISEDQFYNYFKSFHRLKEGKVANTYPLDLYSQVRACLDFAGAKDEPYKTIGINVRKAIIRLALDNRINHSRITNWFDISENEIEESRKELNKEKDKISN